MVPQLRTWRSPMLPAKAASAGIACCTSFDAATAACVVMAPIFTVPPDTVMPCSSLTPPRSTSAAGAARPSFIAASNDWPPASSLASAPPAARAASPTDDGLA